MQVSSSFRDSSGFVFSRDGVIYRQVNTTYRENYDYLIRSGLYGTLIDSGLLVRHEEVNFYPHKTDSCYKILKPEQVGFISYPYEWCFSQLKDASLATLGIQKKALEFGMTLKDASAYNIQFVKGKPKLIDTLSFERYKAGDPWYGYNQFCQHFLAPLALMCYQDIRLNQLFRVHLDGIPLDLASKLLPFRTRFSFPLLIHVHLHSSIKRWYRGKPVKQESIRQISKTSFLGLIDNLESCIRKLRWHPGDTQWLDYTESASNYTSRALMHKKQIVSEFLDRANPKTLWDLGANIGTFSVLASAKGIDTVSFDNDPACVENNYKLSVNRGDTRLLPLLIDLNNPSPGIGWENEERLSLIKRGKPDAILALALIHHFVISNSLPLDKIANLLRKNCRWLIIEFVPQDDSNFQKLVATKNRSLQNYNREQFESEFLKQFSIHATANIIDSRRTLYLMSAREDRC